MKKLLLIALLPFAALAQDTLFEKKTNPVIYFDFSFGAATGSSKGILTSYALNYERSGRLITLRYLLLTDVDTEYHRYGSYPIPLPELEETINEFGIMGGQRFTFDNKSLSVSAGASLYRRELDAFTFSSASSERTSYFGIPFEVDFKWFKRKKSPYRIYEIIPVGGPTSFGNSIGVKLLGSISHTGFIGIGVTVGLGMHKEYDE